MIISVLKRSSMNERVYDVCGLKENLAPGKLYGSSGKAVKPECTKDFSKVAYIVYEHLLGLTSTTGAEKVAIAINCNSCRGSTWNCIFHSLTVVLR